jgi:hypothetical protein
MARRIVDALRRAINPPYQEPTVHFHQAEGIPEVCYENACVRPRLSI